MSDTAGSVISLQPGEKGDGASCSPSAGVPPGSLPPQTDGDSVEPKTDVSPETGSLDGDGPSAGGCTVLTEDGLKELLYTSCSRDSPEFESIINLYLDQVKSHSEEIASDGTCDPLKTIFEHSGLYSKLDLKNFVRLGPSAIGYPSVSWKNVAEKEEGIDAPVESPKDETVDSDQTRPKLKLRITRETHPTPEDFRNDIVLKMIVVEEVNKKDLMGPLRAYLSPEGEVEFHTGSPGQKEGLRDYMRSLAENVDPVSSSNELNFEVVISAITGYPFETNVDGSCSRLDPIDGIKQCREHESLKNREVADGLVSKASGNLPGHDDEMCNDVTDPGSDFVRDDSAQSVGRIDNPDEASGNGDAVLRTEAPTNTLETADKMVERVFVFGKTSPSVASNRAAKPPLWHRGVDLTEIFSHTDSDSDDESGAKKPELLPTGADLKILQLLRSSSSGDSDASGMSGYSEGDIDAGLRRLALGKGDEDGDDEDDSADDGEDVTEEQTISEEEVDTPEPSCDGEPSEASYTGARPMESPTSKLDTVVSLKDLGLQVIDPMGLNVINLLTTTVPYEKKSLKKAKKSKQLRGEESQKKLPNKVVVTSSVTQTPPEKKDKRKAKPPKKNAALNVNAGSSKNGVNDARSGKNGGNDKLKSLENIADALIPDTGEDKDGVNIVLKGDASNPKVHPEKTIPPILGKMPEPAPLGFSRHLASSRPAGTAHPVLGLHPAVGPKQPAAGPKHPAAGPKHPALGVPLVKSNQWFPLLVQVPNQGGRSVVPNRNFQPPPPPRPTPDFHKQIFIKWPDEFGRHVANTLNSMGIEQRARIIEHFIDVLNQNANVDRFGPQNGSNPAQRMLFNPVRPSTRPPFSQNPYGTANPNMTSSSQNMNQSNFGPHQNFWPPTVIPVMRPSQSQLSSTPQNYQVTNKLTPFNPSREMERLGNLFETLLDGTAGNKNAFGTPGSQVASSKRAGAPESAVQNSKASPSKSGKAAKMYGRELKNLKAVKKAAKKAQGDPKFSGAVKNKSVGSSPRKSAVANQKNTSAQSKQNSSQNESNSWTSESSSSGPPAKKHDQTKQPNGKPANAAKVANQGSNQPSGIPITPNPPKTQTNQNPDSKPELPSGQPPQPNAGSNLLAQTLREAGATGGSSKKARKSKKKRSDQSKK